MFGEFLEYLSKQGFKIGAIHHLRLQQLLNRVGGQCAPQDLKTILCPIFATGEEEQELFYRAFDAHFEIFQAAPPPYETEPFADKPATDSEARVATTYTGTRRFLLALILGLLIGFGLYLITNRTKQDTTNSSATTTGPQPTQTTQPTPTTPTANLTQTTQPSPTPTTRSSQTPTTTTPTTFPATPKETPTPPVPSRPTGTLSTFIVEHRGVIHLLVVLLLLACFLSYELIRFRQRNLILERARGRRPPYSWPMSVGTPKLRDFSSEQFYRGSRRLRRRQIGEFHRLDVARTIQATISSVGYPAFRFKPDSRPPEYLFLVERVSFSDHQAQLFDQMVQALEKEGLFLVRYFYDRDPRVCTSENAQGAIYLADLQKKYSEHRLVLCSDGEKLIDPVTGELVSWAALLLEWHGRAILTPSSPASWGLREKTLARNFILLPALLEGIEQLADNFEMPIAPDFSYGRQDDLSPTPLDFDRTVTVEALRSDLGKEVFQWLCACAIYPELHWELTLHLGTLLSDGMDLIQEKHLLKLVRLPWFRSGSMPDELRLKLINELDSEKQQVIRSAIIDLLEKNPAPQGTFAADARQLDIAVQRSWLNRQDLRKLRQSLRSIKRLPSDEIERDYALVRFLETNPTSPLAIHLPGRLRKLFYRKGIPAFGLKSGLRALATSIIIVAAWIGVSSITSETVGSVTPQTDVMTLDKRAQGSHGAWYELAALKEDEGVITTFAFSPDGKLLAAATGTTITLWDIAARTPLTPLKGHRSAIMGLAFAPDGKVLATSSADRTVKIWDISTGNVSGSYDNGSFEVPALAFSPDGKTLALGCDDTRERILDASTLQEGRSLSEHKAPVYAVKFSPDGKLYASASSDGLVNLWDTTMWEVRFTFDTNKPFAPFAPIEFSPDSRFLATGGDSSSVELWNFITGKETATFTAPGQLRQAIAFSPDGKLLVSAATVGTGVDAQHVADIWDITTGKKLTTLSGHPGRINSISFSPDGKILATSSDDQIVRLWAQTIGR